MALTNDSLTKVDLDQHKISLKSDSKSWGGGHNAGDIIHTPPFFAFFVY